MVADAKNQGSSTSQDYAVLVHSQTETIAVKSKLVSLNGDGYILKVRKPYTIKKQRERWTEEEHMKFVEAVKLYGRAWRLIEEHVSTKTAIQIRSHAQKFFAKVTRDSSIDSHGLINPTEIPCPRPKRKPIHPYPRKITDSANTEVIISHQLERSPTSVLSIIGSDNLEYAAAEIHKSRLSPASCAMDTHSANLFFTEKDNEHVKSDISAVEMVFDNKFIMKKELFFQETECSPHAGEAYSSIKLFGKTVMVRDSPKNQS